MKKNTGLIIIVGIVLVGAGVFAYKNFTQKESISKEPKTREEMLAALYLFEVKKENMPEEEKKKQYEQFQTVTKSLRVAQDVWEKDKESEEAMAGMYWPLISIGGIHRDIGDFEKAKNAYLLANEFQPGAFPPLGNLGDLYFRYMQNYAEAEKWFLKAIEIEGAYTELYYSELYEIYRFHFKDEKKAEEFLLSGTEKYPDKLGILSDLALHYRQTGQKEKAIEAYEKLLEKNPESVAAKQALEALK